MPFIATLAGEVKDINPDQASPDDVLQVCRHAQARLNQMLTHGLPLSQQERDTERLLEEIDTIAETVQRDEIHLRWNQEKLAHDFLGRLSEMEQQAYNIFLSSIERLEDGNPLHSLAEAYQEALDLKAKGELPGVYMLDTIQEHHH